MPAAFAKPFLVLETGVPVASMRRYGGFPHWIRVAAGLHRDEAAVCRVADGEAPPADARGYAGVLITGSAAMVTERHAWSERTADWLRETAHTGTPMFGICYGHQLLAHALGGEVGDNPKGREMGTVQLRLVDGAADDPLFAGLPGAFKAQATHRQSVLRAPDGATLLAASGQDGCQAFRWTRAVWGVQFHPEFAAAHMRGYVHARREALAAEGADPHAIARAVRAAPQARRVLRRFVRHVRSG